MDEVVKSIDQWLAEYAVDHQNPTNKLIHKVCVPLIVISLLGMLWCIPTVIIPQSYYFINWATLFTLGCLVFYFLLDKFYFLMMLVSSVFIFTILNYLDNTSYLLEISIITFIISWIGQFWGHKIEGKKPSFIQDLQFLLIGPLWVLKSLLRK